jgi:hypothetical protein
MMMMIMNTVSLESNQESKCQRAARCSSRLSCAACRHALASSAAKAGTVAHHHGEEESAVARACAGRRVRSVWFIFFF